MANNLPSMTSPPWDMTTKRIIALVTLIGLFLIAVQIGAAAWSAIIISVVLAYLLSPVVTFFEGRLRAIKSYEIRRSLAVLLTWLAMLGVVALGFALIIPAMVSQLRTFADDLPALIADTEEDLRDLLDRPIRIGGTEYVPWDQLEAALRTTGEEDEDSSITNTLQDAVLSLADPALGFVGGVVSLVINLFFVLTMLFYLMRDGPIFAHHIVGVLPESYQGDGRRLLHELGQVWNAYLRGQILLSAAIGIATYIAALILGLPQPLLLGMIAGFLEFIPNLGPALSQIPALLFALTTDSATIPGLDAGLLYAVVVSLTYITIQNLEAIFLVPRILGSSLDLHPYVVLVGVLVGGSLAGVLGVVLAAPTIATLRVILRYVRGKLLDEDTFGSSSVEAGQARGLLYGLLRVLLSKRFPTMPADQDAEASRQSAANHGSESESDNHHPDMSGWLNE